ncbi:CRISPR-associated protein Csn2-St [Vagococcus hydrophili]|uniref:Uncharacterized protein n=1 Tax=Vagococcus hydrophili TaxID=2714947 RepID=A0A6G8AVH1_9ENTE|nr:CRISPR-associated protein Csn2-St [Vagococcus hydrophili]QIL48935.1 hypothetical protein G7082_10675 [Vagococcus hydrophili]
MTELKIEYESGRFIEADLEDYLLFVGGQNDWKRKIVRSLKRFGISKSLNELEEGIYGENGIEFYYGEKQLKSRDTNLMFLEDNKSIYDQLSFSKGNLIYQELQEVQHEIDITRQMEVLNNELINLEVILNRHVSKFSDSITSSLGSILFTDILKSNLTLSYFTERRNYPLEMINSSELLDEYVNLLKSMIERNEEMIWLAIINPESFLELNDFGYLFGELKRIAKETKQLKFFVFSNRSLEVSYTSEDIGKTILLYDYYEQMPEYGFFEESIKRHYPSEFEMSESDLVSSFYRIADLIGKDLKGDCYISDKDMVLLRVINDMLEVNVSTETSVQTINRLEEAFLKEIN